MADFYEVDFLDVDAGSSGDAIALRYRIGDAEWTHVVDGGYQKTGESLCSHIEKHYGINRSIDHVVVTHPDGDHAGGIRVLLETLPVGTLWMLRPWDYIDEIIFRFQNITSPAYLRRVLREAYPNVAALEDLAVAHGIPIREPFQGVQIGSFTVLAPSRARYLDLIVDSERTPTSRSFSPFAEAARAAQVQVVRALNFMRSTWGHEVFSPEETSAENNMSVVQWANLVGDNVLLTGDAGREMLKEAILYAPFVGLNLPGIDKFQVPHHGSRRNVSTEVLDQLLGPRHASKSEPTLFEAAISASKDDPDHPRKAVVRAMVHRGGYVVSTEGPSKRLGRNAPDREGWVTATPLPYPEDQETD